jgi:hypothetical protein
MGIALAPDPMEIALAEQKINMESCIKGMSIPSLKKNTGFSDSDIGKILFGMIFRASQFFNITNTMNDAQMIDTSALLLEKYGYESLEDFSLIFKRAKMGDFGKTFNRLDGQIIFEWANKHFEQKIEYREKQHQRIKATVDPVDLKNILLGPEVKGREVIDALKEAIGYDPNYERKEKGYSEFRKEFIKKKIIEKVKK